MSLVTKNRFYSGELSPKVEGNTDLEEYKNGLGDLENLIVLPQGGVTRRNGTQHVAEVKYSDKITRLIPFEFSEDDSYMLEFGDLYFRIYKSSGIVSSTANILTNGTFYSDITGWTHGGTGSMAWNGSSRAIDITAVIAASYAYQSFTATGSTTYNYSLKSIAGLAAIAVLIGTTAGAGDVKTHYFASGTTANGSFTVGAGTYYFSINVLGSGTMTCDDAILTDAASVVDIVTTYLEADVNAIQYAQSADVMYLTHPDYPPQKLIRTDDSTWSISDVALTRQPFRDDILDNTVTFTASATTGSGITITASAATFESGHVGSVWRLRHESEATKAKEWRPSSGAISSILGEMAASNGDLVSYNGNLYQALVATSGIDVGGTLNTGTTPPTHTTGTASDGSITWTYISGSSGTFEITAYSSATSITVTALSTLPTTNATTNWEVPPWSAVKGYPACVSFHEERLWMGATYSKPQTIWGTQTGDFENWDFGAGNEGDAVEYTIASNAVNRIQWLQSGTGLFIGTLGGEYVASGSSRGGSITPRDIRIVPHSRHGSRRIMPRLIANAAVFIQKAGLRIRRFVYDFDVDAFVSEDLNLLSDHITGSGIRQIDYQQEPNSVLWCVRDDGELAGCTLQRELKLKGWHRHIIGGTFDSSNAEATSVGVIPFGTYDRVWLIVKRTINGSTVQYIESLANWTDEDIESAVFMDSAITATFVTPTTAISGLDHLEGESVDILADGLVQANKTVSSGAITLDTAASIIHIGLHKNATMTTMDLDIDSQRSGIHGKIRRISEVIIKFLDTGSCKLNGDTMDFTAGELFTGDKSQNYSDSHDFESKVTITQDEPLPLTILSIYPRIKEGR